MVVNGKEVILEESITVAKYLEMENYQLTRIAVERNGEIVPKATYKDVKLCPEDVLEIVSFVGGG